MESGFPSGLLCVALGRGRLPAARHTVCAGVSACPSPPPSMCRMRHTVLALAARWLPAPVMLPGQGMARKGFDFIFFHWGYLLEAQ